MSPVPPDLIALRHALILQCVAELGRGCVILLAELDQPADVAEARLTALELLGLVSSLDYLAGGRPIS